MRRVRLALLIAALMSAAIALYAFTHLERYEVTIDHGPSPAARGDSYLAAQMFLENLDVPVLRSEELRSPPGRARGRTLLLLSDRSQWTEPQTKRTLDWAAGGGHLVFVAGQLWDENSGRSGDLLLDTLGLQQHESRDLSEGPLTPLTPPHAPELTRLFVEDASSPAYFAFDPAYHLFDPLQRAHTWANSGSATHLLQLPYGEGQITVLTDAWIWENRHIGQFDHAWLLWYLTRDSHVVLVHRDSQPSLVRLLGDFFSEALAALAVLLALALWRASRRLGPVRTASSPGRRQLLTHLRGTADFLLRHEGQGRLLQRLQGDILQRAGLRHPNIETLPVNEQLSLLARLSTQPVEQIRQAMATPDESRLSMPAFTRQVAQLQLLRNAL